MYTPGLRAVCVVAARAGGRTGLARRGIYASLHHSTLVAVRGQIKGRRLSTRELQSHIYLSG